MSCCDRGCDNLGSQACFGVSLDSFRKAFAEYALVAGDTDDLALSERRDLADESVSQ